MYLYKSAERRGRGGANGRIDREKETGPNHGSMLCVIILSALACYINIKVLK